MIPTLSWLARPKGLEPLTYWLEVFRINIRRNLGINKVDIIKEVTKIKSSEFYDNLPCNINFIQKENNLIYIRTFEKGVERETLSCGTGAVASSVVCSKIFEDNFPLIKARGGDLRVNYKKKRDLFYDITLSSNPFMEYNSYLKIISS